MPLFRTQSAAEVTSLAPHDSKARLRLVTTRRRFMAKPCTPHLITRKGYATSVRQQSCQRLCNAQRVQLFKPQTGNVGGRGELPSRSLGGQRGPFSHVREWPPLFTQPLGCNILPLKGKFSKNQMRFFSESESNKCTSLASNPNFTAVCRAYAIGSIFAVGMTATTSCPFAARCR